MITETEKEALAWWNRIGSKMFPDFEAMNKQEAIEATCQPLPSWVQCLREKEVET